MSRAAVFLDRDGVLNPLVLNPETRRLESPLRPEQMQIIDGVIPALLRLQGCGFRLVLVSNQPNMALGKSSLGTLGAIHQKLVTELLFAGIHFDRFFYCLHHPRGVVKGYGGLCVCRKPSPWFLLRARDDLNLSLPDSWMIGDQPTDIQCGHAAGVKTIRIREASSGSGSLEALAARGPMADYSAGDLGGAVEIILNQQSQ